jgi:predicted ABC-type ATPase
MNSGRKRLRVIAGHNGSGKSTLTDIIRGMVKLGIYINADEIKVKILRTARLSFSDYDLSITDSVFYTALRQTPFKSGQETGYWVFENNGLSFLDLLKLDDYFVAFLADFIRNSLLEQTDRFSFETVMSHPSKLDFMRQAKERGFKVYLYFVSLPNPELNLLRVKTRVEQGGHDVKEDKVKERYARTMSLLLDAMKIADNAYIFDNSGSEPKMIAQKESGILKTLGGYTPVWYQEYVLNKI